MPVQNYRDLIVWQKAMGLVKLVYELTKKFPKEELFGLTSDSQGSCFGSVKYRRRTRKKLDQRVSPSFVYCLRLIDGNGDADESKEVMLKSAEVGRLINGLVNSLERKLDSGT